MYPGSSERQACWLVGWSRWGVAQQTLQARVAVRCKLLAGFEGEARLLMAKRNAPSSIYPRLSVVGNAQVFDFTNIIEVCILLRRDVEIVTGDEMNRCAALSHGLIPREAASGQACSIGPLWPLVKPYKPVGAMAPEEPWLQVSRWSTLPDAATCAAWVNLWQSHLKINRSVLELYHTGAE